MSLSIGGYHPGFGHPGAMGLSAPHDYYSTGHYSSPVPGSPDYPMYNDRSSYLHNWVLSGTPDVPRSPADSYGNMCSTPSPVNSLCQDHIATGGFPTNVTHSLKQQWEDYHMSAASLDRTFTYTTTMPPISELANYDTYTNSFGERCYRRRTSANKKERRRTLSINNAFSNLRGSIPNVPSDTKLSKIKTLRLAISYISYLNDVLEKDDPQLTEAGFKADISRKRERRTIPEVKKPADSCESDDSSGSSNMSAAKGARTGWPTHVWASELKTSPQ